MRDDIRQYTLVNRHGVEATIASYGATLTNIVIPDARGKKAIIVLGYDKLSDYCHSTAYLGATIGRYANRIRNGRFSLNGKHYQVSRNDKSNMLHGGYCGFDKKRWLIAGFEATPEAEAVAFSYISPDGDEGFPGTLNVNVRFLLNNDNELAITYTASCDVDTVLNLTNHSYFNLAGPDSQSVLDHKLFLNADRYLPVDEELIPTGEIRSVADSPFDFRTPKLIGRDIEKPNEQLEFCKGYNLSWILNRKTPDAIEFAASVSEERTGRSMSVFTSEPGIQFYSGNQLGGSSAPGAREHLPRSGFCLETQHFPDSPNNPGFPSVVLRAQSIFRSTTILRFNWGRV